MKIRILVPTFIAAIILSFSVVSSADGVTKRIRFGKGKSSATVTGHVVRGDRDTYIVGAKAEQMMTVKITSFEKNAVFQVKGPDGEYLQDAGEEE